MTNVIHKLVNAARRFTALDFAVFKICLVAIGVLLGSYLSVFFMEYINFVWVIAILAWIFLMLQVMRYYKK